MCSCARRTRLARDEFRAIWSQIPPDRRRRAKRALFRNHYIRTQIRAAHTLVFILGVILFLNIWWRPIGYGYRAIVLALPAFILWAILSYALPRIFATTIWRNRLINLAHIGLCPACGHDREDIPADQPCPVCGSFLML